MISKRNLIGAIKYSSYMKAIEDSEFFMLNVFAQDVVNMEARNKISYIKTGEKNISNRAKRTAVSERNRILTSPIFRQQLQDLIDSVLYTANYNDVKALEKGGINPSEASPPEVSDLYTKLRFNTFDLISKLVEFYLRDISIEYPKTIKSAFKNSKKTARRRHSKRADMIEDVKREVAEIGVISYKSEDNKRYRYVSKIRNMLIHELNNMVIKMTLYRCKLIGITEFQITAHRGPRDIGIKNRSNHAYWQGAIVTVDENNKDLPNLYRLTGYGLYNGLGSYGCTHNLIPYIPSKSKSLFTEDELEHFKRGIIKYNGLEINYASAIKELRRLEREYRKTIRLDVVRAIENKSKGEIVAALIPVKRLSRNANIVSTINF